MNALEQGLSNKSGLIAGLQSEAPENEYHIDGMGERCYCRREHRDVPNWIAEVNFDEN
jgi:hypothetical protein